MVNRIVGKGNNVVAAIGMYGKSTTRGRPAVPNQQWRKLLATIPGVTIIDIYNVCNTCSCCGKFLESEESMKKKIRVKEYPCDLITHNMLVQ